MRPGDRGVAQQLEDTLLSFDREYRPLLGIRDPEWRSVLVEQLLESIRRVRYISVIREQELSDRRGDPDDELFDPIKASILQQRGGRMDEAFWLVFLFVHFGKHARARFRHAREVYGRLGEGGRWDWASVSADPVGFREWLAVHQDQLRRGGVSLFGNHRKYQSLDALSPVGTGATVESYVRWVNPPRTHQELIDQALRSADGDPRQAFDVLYRSMRVVVGFGRTARFDYLAMVGKLGLAPIEAGSTYMQQATGPLKGARLLFEGDPDASIRAAELDTWLIELEAELHVGMQVLEDALCNWQKTPKRFRRFRG